MFTPSQLKTIAKLLYIALGYGSRSDRIKAMLDSTDVTVAMTASQLKYAGALKPDTVDLSPFIQGR